jgi:hypothetical protein
VNEPSRPDDVLETASSNRRHSESVALDLDSALQTIEDRAAVITSDRSTHLCSQPQAADEPYETDDT